MNFCRGRRRGADFAAERLDVSLFKIDQKSESVPARFRVEQYLIGFVHEHTVQPELQACCGIELEFQFARFNDLKAAADNANAGLWGD